MSGHGKWRLAAVLVTGGVLATVALAGCSSSGKSSSNTATQYQANGPQADNGKAAAGTDAQGQPGQVLDPTEIPVSAARSVIYTGDITVRVSNVDDAAQRLATLADGVAGYVSADQRSIDSDQSSAAVTLRIPADKFQDTLDAITKLGKEQGRQIKSEDVTAQVVDLDSRMKTQQASVDRVRALLAQATTIAEITSVEGELTRREADLESLKAQLAALKDQAALSTITVNLLGPAAKVTTPKKSHTGFLGGLEAGWHGFVFVLLVLVTVLGALLPFIIAIGVPAWLIYRFVRRRNRARAAAALAARPAVQVGAGNPGPPQAPPAS